VVVDALALTEPGELVDLLHARWARSEPSVIELDVPFEAAPDETYTGPVWGLTPEFTFPLERLHHLVWGHSVDRRDGDVTGAREVGGRLVWVDGGPLAPGAAPAGPHHQVPSIAAERGLARPLHRARSAAELAPDQLEAVHHEGRAARIIAPAGSGKTRVLTERARLLVDGWGVPAPAVCLVAFNTRAAAEMRERLADLPHLQIRTLNSLGLAIIQGTGPFRAPAGDRSWPTQRRVETTDEPEIRRLLDRLVDFPRRSNTDPTAPWLEALTQVRLGLRSPASVEADYGGDVDGFSTVFEQVRSELAGAGRVDFDEQIYGAIELLVRNPSVRRTAQRACRVLLVDEFQDLTPAHLLLIRLLASPRYDVFGVGDDDQTIYGYTGADPTWLIEFDRFFPGAGAHALQVNYRCPPSVVGAAGTLLACNRRRVAKEIVAPSTRVDEPGSLNVRREASPDLAAIEHVRTLVEAGTPPGDIALLTRVNSLLVAAQVGLLEAGIPSTTPMGTNFLDRTGVRSALAWLRIARDPERLSARDVAETTRRPSRGLSPKVIEWMGEQRDLDGIDRLAKRLADKDAIKVQGWASEARRLVRTARNGTVPTLVEHIRSEVGLGRAIDTLDSARRTVDRSSHHDDLDALAALGNLHPDPATFEGWLRAQLEKARGRDSGGPVEGLVQLSTIHRVKGREWPHVVVLHATDGVLPHRLASDREEERRIFHVALTRGQQTVTVVASADDPSPFLDEMAGRTPKVTVAEPALRDTPQRSARTSRRSSTGPEPVAAHVGLEFDEGGYTMEVIELTDDAAVATTPGGRARVTVTFGTTIRVDGDHRVLGPPTAAAPSGTGARPPGDPADEAVRERLRAWRQERAKAENVPAYVVFDNKTLDAIVARSPSTEAELLACPGIGPTKLERYGPDILAVLST
jgi:DNA helicase-2/ATP-dependent DNA helicase PcrA